MAITEKPIMPYLYSQYRYADDAADIFSVHNSALLQRWADLRDVYSTLPDYTSTLITGNLLTWVCESIYGVTRPVLQYTLSKYDVSEYDNDAFYDLLSPASLATDDILRRIVAWNCKRDQLGPFSIPLLKKKVAEFLSVEKEAITVEQMDRSFAVTIPTNTNSTALAACVELDVVNLPAEYSFTITIV